MSYRCHVCNILVAVDYTSNRFQWDPLLQSFASCPSGFRRPRCALRLARCPKPQLILSVGRSRRQTHHHSPGLRRVRSVRSAGFLPTPVRIGSQPIEERKQPALYESQIELCHVQAYTLSKSQRQRVHLGPSRVGLESYYPDFIFWTTRKCLDSYNLILRRQAASGSEQWSLRPAFPLGTRATCVFNCAITSKIEISGKNTLDSVF